MAAEKQQGVSRGPGGPRAHGQRARTLHVLRGQPRDRDRSLLAPGPLSETAFDWDNYLLACSHCNSNQKRDQFPLDPAGLPQLIEPCLEDPLTHLSFSTSTGRYEPRQGSAKGTASIQVFGLNRPVLCDGRCDAWVALGQLLACYADSRAQGNDGLASKIEKLVRRHPFAGVLAALLQIAAGPEPDLFLEPATLKAIQTYPEILTWN